MVQNDMQNITQIDPKSTNKIYINTWFVHPLATDYKQQGSHASEKSWNLKKKSRTWKFQEFAGMRTQWWGRRCKNIHVCTHYFLRYTWQWVINIVVWMILCLTLICTGSKWCLLYLYVAGTMIGSWKILLGSWKVLEFIFVKTEGTLR